MPSIFVPAAASDIKTTVSRNLTVVSPWFVRFALVALTALGSLGHMLDCTKIVGCVSTIGKEQSETHLLPAMRSSTTSVVRWNAEFPKGKVDFGQRRQSWDGEKLLRGQYCWRCQKGGSGHFNHAREESLLVQRRGPDSEWIHLCGLAAQRKFRGGRKKLPREARRGRLMSRALAVERQSNILSL